VPAYSPPRKLASGCNCAEHARVTVLPAYRATILPEWIDYNGHLRDAYYMVALSYAIDEVMDHLGLDAAYRERTECTLYTLELHMHFLQEVKSTDELTVTTSILDFDRKRIHAGCEFSCPRMSEAAATAEVMLLHVHQGDKPASASFPPEVLRKLETLKLSPDVLAARGLGSRKIELKRR
jgi:acyl-CoA thioester hydrolase